MPKSPIIVATPFPDKDGDGIIAFGAANLKLYAAQLDGSKRVIYQPGEPAHTYWPEGYTPPVVAPPPPPPPVFVQVGAEVFGQSPSGNGLAVGLNAGGTLGTAQNAPEGVLTSKDTGYLRLGLLKIKDGKVASGDMLKGLPVGGYVVAYDGATLRSFERIGYDDLPGVLTTDGQTVRFTAAKGPLALEQAVTLDGDHLTYAVKLTNTGAVSLKNLRYMFVIDPDVDPADGGFTTDNRIVDRRTVTGGAGGAILTLASPDSRAAADVRPLAGMPSTDVKTTPKAVGYAHKGDDTLHLLLTLADLAPGASDEFGFTLGVA